MSTPKETAAHLGAVPQKKKRSVWWMNILSGLPMLFTLALSSPDPVTRLLTSVCLAVSLGAAYFSVRSRVNVIGLLLLAIAVYFNALFLVIVFEKA